jgi:hypothetical protein
MTFILPGTIEKVMDIFAKNPNIDVVFGDTLICDQHNHIIDYNKHPNFDVQLLLHNEMMLQPQATFWRRKVHENIGGFDLKYKLCGDRDFFVKMGVSGAKFYHVPGFLACYRVHGSQTTRGKQLVNQEIKQIIDVYERESHPSKFALQLRLAKEFIKQSDGWYVARALLRRLGLLFFLGRKYKNYEKIAHNFLS